MGDFPALEVALGLAFTYFILSLVCSTLNEVIANLLRLRAKKLERGIQNLLSGNEEISEDGKRLAETVLRHPLLQSLSPPKTRLNWRPRPSYIPSRQFVSALLAAKKATTEIEKVFDELPDPLERTLRALYDEAGRDAAKFRAATEEWFDDAMERVSGWYRRQVQVILFVLALGVAWGLNADSIQIADRLWKDEGTRKAVVARAEKVGASSSSDQEIDLKKTLKDLEVPLGWSGEAGDLPRDFPNDVRAWTSKIFGLFLTAFALLLGAPFWFDLLSKVARIRGSGAPPPATGGVRTGEAEQARAQLEVSITPGGGAEVRKPEPKQEPGQDA